MLGCIDTTCQTEEIILPLWKCLTYQPTSIANTSLSTYYFWTLLIFIFFFFLIYCVSLFWSYLNWICYTHSFYIWTVSSSFKFVSIGVTRNQEELFYNPRAKKSINFSSAIFYLWSASFSILSLTMLIAAWISGSMGYDLETLCLMSASGKLTSVSFPILLCISCSLWVSVSLGNECLLMSLERRDFNIGRTSWEVLVSLIYRDFSGLLVYFPFFFSK